MGKKGTKRKTRWRALPLGEDDGGSGNEEEVLDEDQSTTSSVIGHLSTTFKVHQPVCKQYRQPRRFLYDRFRNKEPLVKLESKTFDEEEYTKITTPRQDVLFKKGYFGRKRECSAEETVPNTGEAEGEEPVMDQYIITNGFVDEQGHYYVNGSSYEVYDPYSNTVTVVVGPPPYTNGVTQPVLAAVSCQPVPLQPVEWYPPGSDWPSQGSAWTPSYSPNPQADPNMSASLTNCETDSVFNGHERQGSGLHPQTAYVVPNYEYGETQVYNSNDVLVQSAVESTTEVLCSKDDQLETELKRIRRESETLNGKEEKEKVEEKMPAVPQEEKESNETEDSVPNAAKHTANSESKEVTITKQENPEIAHEETKLKISGKETTEMIAPQYSPVRHVEKQSHSTQTNLLECESLIQKPAQPRVKESHSTQTMPEETLPASEPENIDTKIDKNNRLHPDTALSFLLKNDREGKPAGKSREIYRSTAKHVQEEPVKKFCQKRLNGERKPKPESKPFEQVTISSFKISYAKKVLNGLKHPETKEGKLINCTNSANNVKTETINGSSDTVHTQVAVANELLSSNLQNKINYNSKRSNNDKLIVAENKRNNNARLMNSNFRNGYERHAKFGRNMVSPKQLSKTVNDPIVSTNRETKDKNKKLLRYEDKQKSNLPVSVENVSGRVKCNGETQNNDCKTQSEKSSTISELSSPTELSSGQNTPPEKMTVTKMEQEITNDLDKGFEEKLKENLTKTETDETFEGKENSEEGTDKTSIKLMTESNVEDDSKKKQVDEAPVKEKPKTSKSKKKKKKKAFGLKDDNPEDFMESLLFLQENGKSQDFLFKAWQGINNEQIAEIPDIDSYLTAKKDEQINIDSYLTAKKDEQINMDSYLTAKKDEILESLEKWRLPRLPLVSELSLFTGFGRECSKLTFENMFTPAKKIQYDLFTKTNITNMRSSRPEEFFASIVENPLKELTKSEKKEGGRSGKKKVVATEKRATPEVVKTGKCGNQVSLKKGASTSKSEGRMNKNSSPCKTNGNSEKVTNKIAKEDKKNEVTHEEAKLGIVDAVNTWLQEHGDSKKILSFDSLSESLEKLAEEKENEEPDQKNGLSNPIHALSVENNCGSSIDAKEDDTCIRVANISKDDGFLRVDGTITEAKKNATKLFRSSSWDAKLSEMQMKKHFKLLTEASSWDRTRKKTDAKLKKHFKFITNSASYCHDLIGDVRNGFELATEELCDPRQSVSKYYTLSPSILDSFDRSNEMECESEVFDALEYKFLGRHGVRSRDTAGEGLSITDSGVHSDMESNEEGTSAAASDPRFPVAGKQTCCKMQ